MADEWTVVNRKKEKSKQQQRNSQRQRQGIGQSKIQNNDLKDNNKGFNEDIHVSSSSKKSIKREQQLAKAKAFAKSLNSNVGDDTDHSENNGDDSLSNRGVENVDDSISLRNLVEVIEGCMNAMLHQSCSTCDRDVRIKSNIFDCRTLMNAIRCAASPQYIDNNINENSNATCGDFGDTSDPLLMNRISNENRQKNIREYEKLYVME